MKATQLTEESKRNISSFTHNSCQKRHVVPYTRRILHLAKVTASFIRNFDMEMRLSSMETCLESIKVDIGDGKADISCMKEDMTATRVAINQLFHNILHQKIHVSSAFVPIATNQANVLAIPEQIVKLLT
ncbi:hypothetical protein YC2023_122346 [Brassica napus]